MLKMDQRKILDGREKKDEDTLLFDFFSPRNPRTVLGLSLERRSVSSFVHTKEDRSPPKPYTSRKVFSPSFPQQSHGENFRYFGTKKIRLFMVVTHMGLDRIRAGVCYNSNHFEFQFSSIFFSPLSDLKRDLSKKFGYRKYMEAPSFYRTK